MVRVLMCHKFKEQKIFSDAYEPTAIACSVSRDLVFVGTTDSHVYVYSLAEDGFPLVYHFPSISPSQELVFSDVSDYLATRETTRKDKPGQCTARVYFNWFKWRESQSNQKIKIQQVGFSVTQSHPVDPETVTVVEILSRFSVRGLVCCPVTGKIAVATETRVTVYRPDCSFDFHKVYIVEPGFSILKLAICGQFIAFSSAVEVRVLEISMAGQSAVSTEQTFVKDGFNSETEQFLTQGILSTSVTQREVFDEDFVVWSFDQHPEASSGQSSFWENILASREWSDSDLRDYDQTPSFVKLPSINKEVPFIDYSEEACEVLGPVKVVHGHPLKVQGALTNVQDMTMLYRYFEADAMKTSGDSLPELHTLQLIPFYAHDDSDEGSSPKLYGMMCFVSSPKKGFIYNVFSKTEFVSLCTYTCDTKMAAVGENLLYAFTSQAVETYTIPHYPAIAKTVKTNQSSDSQERLEVAVITMRDEIEVNGGGRSDGNSEIVADHASSDEDCSTYVGGEQNGVTDVEKESKKAIDNCGFPVYDLDILQKPCPLQSNDLCMIGVHSFNDLYWIMTAGDWILLLSDSSTNQPSKHRSRKSKGKSRKDSQTKDWTLHVLKAMDMQELYHRMECLTEKSENLNADLRLLKEQHWILRAQFKVGIPEIQRNSLLEVLQNSVRNLGDYFARYAMDEVKDVLLYYTMGNLSIEDVLDRHVRGCVETDKIKDKKFGKGLVCYLNDVLFTKNQDKNCINLPQTTADKVLYIYSNAAPARLSILILRPLIDGYTSELAVKLLTKLKKAKTYSFGTEDHLALAIVYLKVCALEHAVTELLNLPREKLAEICVKHHYMLYENNETLSPLGQLLRRRIPKVFVKTLVSLHLRGITSLKNTIHLLQSTECENVNNSHLLEYLELILNDQKGKKSFKEAREILVEIYLEKLAQQTTVQRRDLPRFPHHHVPRGSGHFSKRFTWLDELPPFNGCVTEPKDCPSVKANIVTSAPRGNRGLSGLSRSRAVQPDVSGPGAKTLCNCCCCWETLLKLQSLLCSRYCDKELGNFVLSSLAGRSLSCGMSIALLCLPLVDQHEKAVESLLLDHPSVVLTYAKQFFCDSHVQWQCVLNVLTQKIRAGKMSEASYNIHKEILRGNADHGYHESRGGIGYLRQSNLSHLRPLECSPDALSAELLKLVRNTDGTVKETLAILSKYTTPTVFLSLLPRDGNFAFFLPFLVDCCQKNAAQNLSKEITAR